MNGANVLDNFTPAARYNRIVSGILRAKEFGKGHASFSGILSRETEADLRMKFPRIRVARIETVTMKMFTVYFR